MRTYVWNLLGDLGIKGDLGDKYLFVDFPKNLTSQFSYIDVSIWYVFLIFTLHILTVYKN